MTLNTLKCNHLTSLGLKGLKCPAPAFNWRWETLLRSRWRDPGWPAQSLLDVL